MPLNAADLATAAAAAPTKTVATGRTGGTGMLASVQLRFNGPIEYDPADVITALESVYGAGKISSDDDSIGDGTTMRLVINP